MCDKLEPADRMDVADLFARLARLLDEGRPEDIHTVYAEDIVVRSPRGELTGIDQIVAFLRSSHVEGEHTQHTNSDVLVSVDGDRIEASAYQVVHYYRHGEAPHRRSGLRLAYTAVRSPAGWRFREGRVTLAWTQDS